MRYGNQYDIIKLIDLKKVLEDEDWEVRATVCPIIELLAIKFSNNIEVTLLKEFLRKIIEKLIYFLGIFFVF